MTRGPIALLVAIGLTATVHAAAPPLGELLARAGAYVQHFEQTFGVVIGDETYRQDLMSTSNPHGFGLSGTGHVGADGTAVHHRETRSEMLFMWTPEEGAWFGVRNVLVVNDNSRGWRFVRDHTRQIAAILKDTTPQQRSRLRRLADESARFNIGRTFRNFNTPTLTVQFLDPAFQPRFDFTIAGEETIGAAGAVVKLAFVERQTPTVVTREGGRDLPASGLIWVRPLDGVVVRTVLTLTVPRERDVPGMRTTLRVEYRLDPDLNVWAPLRMEEEYDGGERVRCVATYSNFHVFQTSARLVR